MSEVSIIRIYIITSNGAQITNSVNGTNSLVVSTITGESPHEEVKPQTHTFDLIKFIRVGRLQWLGHILRSYAAEPGRDETTHTLLIKRGETRAPDAPKTVVLPRHK